jgi:hypothetical protein
MYSKLVATITELLNSAQTLFLRKNHVDLTMGDVAVAGMTKGAIYRYSDSKASLYVTTFQGADSQPVCSGVPISLACTGRDYHANGIQNREWVSDDPRLGSWLYVTNVEVLLTPYVERIFDNRNEILDFVIHLFFKGGVRY